MTRRGSTQQMNVTRGSYEHSIRACIMLTDRNTQGVMVAVAAWHCELFYSTEYTLQRSHHKQGDRQDCGVRATVTGERGNDNCSDRGPRGVIRRWRCYE
jgi:hypothetical protein